MPVARSRARTNGRASSVGLRIRPSSNTPASTRRAHLFEQSAPPFIRMRLVEERSRCYCDRMTLKARVKAGRLVVDEPIDLPEGTEVELLPLDPGDWLDDEARAALHRALKDSDEDVKAGRLVDADVVLRELRSR